MDEQWACHSCNYQRNPGKASKCYNCGRPRSAETLISAAPVTPPSPVAPAWATPAPPASSAWVATDTAPAVVPPNTFATATPIGTSQGAPAAYASNQVPVQPSPTPPDLVRRWEYVELLHADTEDQSALSFSHPQPDWIVTMFPCVARDSTPSKIVINWKSREGRAWKGPRTLSVLGDLGWELVSAGVTFDARNAGGRYLVFKRPLPTR